MLARVNLSWVSSFLIKMKDKANKKKQECIWQNKFSWCKSVTILSKTTKEKKISREFWLMNDIVSTS